MPADSVSSKGSLPCSQTVVFPLSSRGEGAGEPFGASKVTDPIHDVEPDPLSRAPPPSTATLGVRIATCECGGGWGGGGETNIWSIALV